MFLDLGHSLDLEHKAPATELGRYIKRYLDLGHLFSGHFVQNWLEFSGKYLIIWCFLHKIKLKTAIFVINFGLS